jgi:hypothetical protein
MARIERREPLSVRRKDGLLQHARDNAFSQNGEDGILNFIFQRILPPRPGVERWCVDIGALRAACTCKCIEPACLH